MKKPLVCTSANLTKQARENSRNLWALGYIPNLVLTSKDKRNGKHQSKRGRSATTRYDYLRYHSILLQPLVDLQQGDGGETQDVTEKSPSDKFFRHCAIS